MNGAIVRRVRKLGPYQKVSVVDVAGLKCNVDISYAPGYESMVVVSGPALKVGKLATLTLGVDGETSLIIAPTRAEVEARQRLAIVDSLTNSSGSGDRFIIEYSKPYQKLVPGSPMTVTLFVRIGTVVIH